MKYNSEGRVGVYSVAKIFEENLKWIFRDQPINDFGIDAFVEITDLRNIPTGKLIGVQIKSGKSFFLEEKEDHFIFRGSKKHLAYWLNHSIPVILAIYDKDTKMAYWQEVNNSTVVLTKKSFKVNILKKNVLGNKSRGELTGIAFFRDSYQYKLWQLQTSAQEIKLLIKKQLFLYIEIDDIPNTNYYHITLVVSDEDCENFLEIIYSYTDGNRYEYNFHLLENNSLTEAMSDTLPWADLFVDGARLTDERLTTRIANEILGYNQEDFIQDVSELREKNAFLQLACYLTGSYCFQIELKANQLSYAFLHIDAFLNKEPIVKTRIYI